MKCVPCRHTGCEAKWEITAYVFCARDWAYNGVEGKDATMTSRTATLIALVLLSHAFAAYWNLPAVELPIVLAFGAGWGISAVLFGLGMSSRWRLALSFQRRGGSGPRTHAHAESDFVSG